MAAPTNADRGRALLRVAREIAELIEGEDVPQSLIDDLKSMGDTARWLITARPIKLPAKLTSQEADRG